ncbi:MAG: hypothetical protein KA099_04720 [Alphaproteobacteria bacterium]|nr:hypothetical protein [Alphaproteobacteria bacterium]MBP7759615.1 hypothetical protein [Alphaproteobacteria bacterium]MBP7763154.1 hypothetical protein [Alphaproteobacteria bacterium]MBP7904613.1 hypothetical protein [Alphaproteobacteria bacterium]
MGEEMELEALLTQRSMPEMRSHLPDRILAEAMKHTQAGRRAAVQESSFSFKGWWADFWDGFALPQPALVMSVVLLLGIFAGTALDTGVAESEPDQPSFDLVVSDGSDLEAFL